MRIFQLKIINKPWFFPLFLLLLGVIAYGLIIPWLGFYWDDWEGVYLHQLNHPAISFQYYAERPLSAISYLMLFPLVRMTPTAWQVTSLLLRWGGVLFIFYTLNLVWPSRLRQNRWAAALLFVFPGFLEQSVSVAFSPHFTTYLFFACSLYLMILAIKQRKLFLLWMPLSIILAGLQIFMMEYFVGLEILRPILIWFALHTPEQNNKLFRKIFLYWFPFLLVLLVYLYWRLVYLPASIVTDPNNPVLLQTMLTSPWTGLSALVNMIYQDFAHLLLYIWPKAFLNVELVDISSKRVWMAWFCGALAGLGFFLYNRYTHEDEHDDDHLALQLIFIGLVIFLSGAGPVWATGRQIAVGKWSERFALAPMLGVILIIVNLVEWLFRTRKQKQILLTLLLIASVSGQFTNQIIFRNDWELQKKIYWQLHWRVPSLKPGTALFSRGTFTEKSSSYNGSYIVNLIFDDSVQQDFQYAYFDLPHVAFDASIPGIPLSLTSRGPQFSGNTAQALVFDFGARAGCVRVLDSIYQGDPDINSNVAKLGGISDVTNISASPDAPLLEDIFGAEPDRTWCYYFEKADLARQMQDWEVILQLKAAADQQGYRPDLAGEYLPFIAAYANSALWEQAYLLSEEAYQLSLKAVQAEKIPFGLESVLCNTWKNFEQFDSTEEMLYYTDKARVEFCPIEVQ